MKEGRGCKIEDASQIVGRTISYCLGETRDGCGGANCVVLLLVMVVGAMGEVDCDWRIVGRLCM